MDGTSLVFRNASGKTVKTITARPRSYQRVAPPRHRNEDFLGTSHWLGASENGRWGWEVLTETVVPERRGKPEQNWAVYAKAQSISVFSSDGRKLFGHQVPMYRIGGLHCTGSESFFVITESSFCCGDPDGPEVPEPVGLDRGMKVSVWDQSGRLIYTRTATQITSAGVDGSGRYLMADGMDEDWWFEIRELATAKVYSFTGALASDLSSGWLCSDGVIHWIPAAGQSTHSWSAMAGAGWRAYDLGKGWTKEPLSDAKEPACPE